LGPVPILSTQRKDEVQQAIPAGWQQEGHPATKTLLQLPSITLSYHKIQNEDILVPANPGPPGKWPLKRTETGTRNAKMSEVILLHA